MRIRDSLWSITGKDPVSIANKRICLALLRIFRNVRLSVTPSDHDDIAAPFWPLLRDEWCLLKEASQKMYSRRAVRADQSDSREASALEILLSDESPAGQVRPDREALTSIGGALLGGHTELEVVFDAIESKLRERVASERLPFDENVEILARSLDLTTTEKSFLSLACALEQSSICTSLFRYPVSGRARVLALQQALGEPSHHEVHALLTLNGNLARSGLLKHDLSLHHDLEDGLVLSRTGAALLSLEIRSPQDMAAAVLKPLAASNASTRLEWPHLQKKTAVIERLLKNALEQGATGVNIMLYGGPGTGKSEFAKDLVARLGLQGYQVEDTAEDQSPATRKERLASLVLSQIFAPAHQSVLVLDEAEDIFQGDYNNRNEARDAKSEPSKSWMNALLEGTRVPTIWISNRIGHIDPAYLRRFSYCLEFPTTPREVRQRIASEYLEPAGCSPATARDLARSEHVSPALLASTARVVLLAGGDSAEADHIARDVLEEHMKAIGRDMPASVPTRATRFDLAYLNVRGRVTPAAIIEGLHRTGKGTALLGGPPGTGKTQFAAEIAERLGRELVYKTAADVNSMWFGESERNVARMFTECDPVKEVLFLDEADTLLGARESAGQRADKAVTAEFLRRVEAFTGIFVCATNHSADFDSAMMRRFMYRLTFMPLDMERRTRLFKECALGWDASSDAKAPELAASTIAQLAKLDQLTPGDFANVVKRVRSLQLDLTPQEWIDELEAEHATKPAGTRPRIGFI